MGLLGKIFTKGYRWLRYGKQVGKTANNGSKVYKRAGTTTGLDKNGKVIRQVRTQKTGPNTTTTESYSPIPFSQDWHYSRRVTTENENEVVTDIFRCRKSPSGYQRNVTDTPWNIQFNKNKETGEILGIKDIELNGGRQAKRTSFSN